MKKFLMTMALAAVCHLGAGTVATVAADTPDGWITAKTRIVLMTTEGVDTWDLNVDTSEGVVTLHGKVASDAAKALAERETRKLDGVKQVKNLLQVVAKPAREASNDTDDVIKDRVEAAIGNDAVLKVSGISVASVNKGVVLLTGTATTIEAHAKAIDAVHAVKGVRRVSSNVKVKADKS